MRKSLLSAKATLESCVTHAATSVPSQCLRCLTVYLGFIGESGAHSFLEQIRQLFRQVSGESLFTEDQERFNMVDGPTHNILPNATVQLPSRALANELVHLFEIRIQPFSYVFDMDEFKRVLDTTYENPIACPRDWLCLIHLTFALAGVYLPETVDSGKFFESGMGLCVGDLIENGDFWIVQAYLLVGLYYQITCKRNAFWIAIGTLHSSFQCICLW
jgi:hypothetical protein